MTLVDRIAQAIRAADGSHTMGAGELAEHIAALFPDGWAKIDGEWRRIELVNDQWGRTDAEGNPVPASYVKPPVYRIANGGGDGTDG